MMMIFVLRQLALRVYKQVKLLLISVALCLQFPVAVMHHLSENTVNFQETFKNSAV